MIKSIAISVAFSLFYLNMYPTLIGKSVIYHYPPWPPPLAATYVAGGILLQAWFSFGRERPVGKRLSLWPQVVTGILYALAAGIFPGGIYQS